MTTTYKTVPELLFWYYNFIFNRFLNKNMIPRPSFVEEATPLPCAVIDSTASFIELLFNEDFDKTDYTINFKQTSIWPRSISKRLIVYGNFGQVFILDKTGSNIFNLQNIDIFMLDKLLEYRVSNVFDETGITFISDSTSVITNLSTNLSRMVFLYLDLVVNGEDQSFELDDSVLFPYERKLLDLMYETFLIEKFFLNRANLTDSRPSVLYTSDAAGP